MKIVAISDTHGHHKDIDIPFGDVIIHSGDITRKSNSSEVNDFIGWFSGLKCKHKILVAGNHDRYINRKRSEFIELIKSKSIIYLENASVCIDNFKFYGSPYTRDFGVIGSFVYNDDHSAKLIWDQIPSDTDILITHEPPLGFGDLSRTERIHSGCNYLMDKVKTLKPSHHLFGHIHEAYGVYSNGDTVFVNSSLTNCAEELVNKPIELLLRK